MKTAEKISAYCEARGIDIPAGFSRHPAARYAVIDLSKSPQQLVARTWFRMADVVYYLRHIAAGTSVRILDFKDGVELIDEGKSRLRRGLPINPGHRERP